MRPIDTNPGECGECGDTTTVATLAGKHVCAACLRRAHAALGDFNLDDEGDSELEDKRAEVIELQNRLRKYESAAMKAKPTRTRKPPAVPA